MKKVIAIILAMVSALYFVIGVIIPDFLPFIDEGIALVVFLNTTAYLGYDFRKFFPFSKRGIKEKKEYDV